MIIVINRKQQHYCLFRREFNLQSSKYQRYIFFVHLIDPHVIIILYLY